MCLTLHSAGKPTKLNFQLTDAEAKVAVKSFKEGTGYERSIFDKVQAALGEGLRNPAL